MSTLTMNTTELSISKIDRTLIESLEPQIKKVDSDPALDLFCYISCDENDPDYVKACRGVVFHGDKLLLKAFSYTPDYTVDQVKQLTEKYPSTSSYTFTDSYEGAIVRIFALQTGETFKWYISTHRRLDAFKSRWSSSTSFGEFFLHSLEYEFSKPDSPFRKRILESPLEEASPEKSVLDKFLSTLNIDHQYMFLLCNNNENRIVCNASDYPKVFHVGTYSAADNAEVSVDVDLPKPKQHSFDTLNDAFEYIENTINFKQLQGLLLFTEDGPIKLMNRDYKYLYDLRGNEFSIKFRYLQLRMDAQKKADFMELYPDYCEAFEEYEDAIYTVVVSILNAYVDRYIRKKHVTVPPEEFAVMRDCHKWYSENRDKNHITFNKVMEVMNTQNPTKINKMIRRSMAIMNPKRGESDEPKEEDNPKDNQ
jgi:hypothetical protein